MDILSKSLYTYLDLTMDHFKMSYEVRGKYLIWLADFFDASEGHIKKWSKLGVGIDYYTFKNWIAKENRFIRTNKKWPTRNFRMAPHYHSAESVLEVVLENSYEEKLRFYEALVLLSLVDKKYISTRIDFLTWTSASLELEKLDCEIIRDHVIEEFNLSFDLKNLQEVEKEDIFLCGIKMAHLSGEIIDKNEASFLDILRTKLSLENEGVRASYFYYFHYGRLSENPFHSSLSLHKLGAILLTLMGCDSLVDKDESLWFKRQMGGLDNNLLSSLLSTDMNNLINGLQDEEKMLCYLLGLEVSLVDGVLHKNEEFWLNFIYESISADFIMDHELTLMFFEVLDNSLNLVSSNWNYFRRVSEKMPHEAPELCARWNYLYQLEGRDCQYSKVSSLLFREVQILCESSKRAELISLSNILGTTLPIKNLSRGLHERVSAYVRSSVEGVYGEMLICEILKISLLDQRIESLEDDFLRQLQDRFKLSDAQIHKVVFITSLLLGERTALAPRVNYNFL